MTGHFTAHSDDAQIDRLIAECMRRVDRGETIDVERLIAENPRHADQLRDYFDSLSEFERLAATALSDDSDDESPRVPGEHDTGTSAQADSARPGSTAPSKIASGPIEFGRYRLLKLLGQGAMGAVYLAHDARLDRRVAIKFPKLDIGDPADSLARFEREARAAAAVGHPNICPIYDVGEIEGVRYISMAYVEGRTLGDWVRSADPPSPALAAALARKLALALAEAHERGIVHRDLKPSNVLIDRRGEPLITDFGLARVGPGGAESGLTRSELMLGTPAYMAPEQVDPAWGEVGPATDIYALGAVLYEMLTGRPPFQGSAASIIGQIVSRVPAAPSSIAPQVDPRLEKLCLAMLAKRPAARPASMRAAAEALERIAAEMAEDPRPSAGGMRPKRTLPALPVLLWAGGAAAVAGLAFAIPSWLGSDQIGEQPAAAPAIAENPATTQQQNQTADRQQPEPPVQPEQQAEAQRPALSAGTLFTERFDGGELSARFDIAADPNFHSWTIADGTLLADRLLPGGPRSSSIRSKDRFELDERGLRYSVRIFRPEGTVPGGSSVGLVFGDYCVDFHPGHPADGLSGDYGGVSLRKELGAAPQSLFQNVAMPFIPALDAWHTVTARVTPQGESLLIRIRIEGPDTDGNPHVFETRFLDAAPAHGPEQIGVIVFGRNPPGTAAARFDDLEVVRPAD